MTLTEDQENACSELRYCIMEWIAAEVSQQDRATCMGKKYALDMAAEEVKLLGLDPQKVTPTGYDDQEPEE